MSVQDTIQQRKQTHGPWSHQAEATASLKLTARVHGTQKLTSAQQEALDMIFTKIGRVLTGNPNEPDHWHDIAGYATLVENELTDKKLDV